MAALKLRGFAPLLMVQLACSCEAPKARPEQVETTRVVKTPEQEDDDHKPRATRSLPAPSINAEPSAALPAFALIPAPSDLAAAPKDALRTNSGLALKVLTVGTGKQRPKLEDRLKVHYTGWGSDGLMFDSSRARGTPKILRISQTIKAFAEALPLMVLGEQRRLWVPSNLAYGASPPAGVPSGPLVFDLELLDIFTEPETPIVPTDVTAPPKSAAITASGVAYQFLSKGPGTEHPSEKSRATIHYSAWTKDGVLFDSSIPRGHPSSVALDQLVKGLSEGVRLMATGDKARFWIPSSLAFGDPAHRGQGPEGQVVFDVELLTFHGDRR